MKEWNRVLVGGCISRADSLGTLAELVADAEVSWSEERTDDGGMARKEGTGERREDPMPMTA